MATTQAQKNAILDDTEIEKRRRAGKPVTGDDFINHKVSMIDLMNLLSRDHVRAQARQMISGSSKQKKNYDDESFNGMMDKMKKAIK